MSARLFVDGLGLTVSRTDISSLLSPFGTIEEIDLRENAVAMRYAFVDFVSPDAAAEAERRLNRTRFLGRTISVLHIHH